MRDGEEHCRHSAILNAVAAGMRDARQELNADAWIADGAITLAGAKRRLSRGSRRVRSRSIHSTSLFHAVQPRGSLGKVARKPSSGRAVVVKRR